MIGCIFAENFLAYELTPDVEHRGSGLPVCPNVVFVVQLKIPDLLSDVA